MLQRNRVWYGCVKPNGLQVHSFENNKKEACPFFLKYIGSCRYKRLGFIQRNQKHKNPKTAVFAKLGRRTRNGFCEKFYYGSYNKRSRYGCRSVLLTASNTKLLSQRQLKKNRFIGKCHICKKIPLWKMHCQYTTCVHKLQIKYLHIAIQN